jgi:hypothetical protein
MVVRASAPRVAATARVMYDATTSTLRWSVQLTGAAMNDVQAVVLRRTNNAATVSNPAQSARVITRLLGPGMRDARGSLQLSGAERRALTDGRIVLALYNTGTAAPVETVLRLAVK